MKTTCETAAPWEPLYRAGGTAALGIVGLMVVQLFIYFIWPPPTTVEGWFALFRNSPLGGLLAMDLLLMVDYLLMVPVVLALYIAVRPAGTSQATIALVLALMATAIYFAANTAFNMLLLGSGYAEAATEAERVGYLAAGQAMLAVYEGTAFNVSYVTSAVAFLIFSVVMLRSNVFSRATAYTGIAMSALMLVPSTAGSVGMILSLLSLIPTAVWLVLVARTFYRMGSRPHVVVGMQQAGSGAQKFG